MYLLSVSETTKSKKSVMTSVIRLSAQRQFQKIENANSLISFLKRPYYANIQIPTFIWGSLLKEHIIFLM